MRQRTLLIAAVFSLPLAITACSSDEIDPEPTSTSQVETTEVEETEDPEVTEDTDTDDVAGSTPTGTDSPEVSEDDEVSTPTPTTPSEGPTTPEPVNEDVDPLESLPWLTEETSGKGSGDHLGKRITEVRTGLHDDYDRVVVQFAGDYGVPSWRVDWVDEPVAAGSGMPLDVEGDSYLQLTVEGLDWLNSEQFYNSGDAVEGASTEELEEVYFGVLFEGQQQLFLGLDDTTSYRVFTLEEPSRLVVDIKHDS